MKKELVYSAFLAVILAFAGCQKEVVEPLKESSPENQTEGKKIEVVMDNIDIVRYHELNSENEARLASLNQSGTRSQSITVPDDYPTIQAAVDAASAGANIFVKSGTYEETVTVMTPGLKIQAQGNVMLNGGFRLIEGADNVIIKKFSIDVTLATDLMGILASGITGGQIVQNEITGPGLINSHGILAMSVINLTIRENHVSDVGWGISVLSRTDIGEGYCLDNKILGNSVTGTAAVGIQLQGECDETQVINNFVSFVPADANPAITILGAPEGLAPPVLVGLCNGNSIKNNICTDSGIGFGIAFEAYDNSIGPDNAFSSNELIGIYLLLVSDNLFFENTALDNGLCDIYIEESPGNTFRDNTYSCMTEI